MNSETIPRSERRRTVWLGCATLALITIVGALVRKTTGPDSVSAACVHGGGTLVMAWLTARASAYPRWAWRAAAGVLVLPLVLAAVLLPAPAQVETWSSTAWMLPWLFLVIALSPARAAERCSPRGARGGSVLIGMSAVFSSILLGVWWLTR